MPILLVGGEKGGTGKTTIATNLAAVRASTGRDVVLIDTDPQGSAAYWCAVRDQSGDASRIACIQLHGRSIARQIQDTAQRYEDVIVDAGGRDSVELRAALTVADYVLTPIQASQFDTWTLEAMSELITQAGALNPNLYAAVCINRASSNPRVTETPEAQDLANDYEALVLLKATLHDRIAYRNAARAGLGVTEANGDAKAAREIEELHQEIYQ